MDVKPPQPPLPQIQRHRSGAVLLMSLLVMAAITASTIAVSVVINNSLAQTSSLDDFILASVAADTGLERGLGIIAFDRQDQASDFYTALGHAETPLTYLDPPRNRTSFEVSSLQGPDPVTIAELLPGAPYAFDIYSPFDHRYLLVTATCDMTPPCDRLLEISWTVTSTLGQTYAYREVQSDIYYEDAPPVLDLIRVFDSNGTIVEEGTISPLAYRIRLRAVGGILGNVQAEACSDPNCAVKVPIAGRIKLESTGHVIRGSLESQSVKNAFVLWQPPSTGVLNYVLFSEESIIP